MPTYEYRCDNCDRNFDVVQSFHDDPLEACPTCESPVRKVFGTVGIVFKGSGFYKTDSRTSASAKDGDGAAAPASDGSTKESASSDGGGQSSGSGDSGAGTSTPSSKEPKETKPTPKAAPASTGNGKSSGAKESAKA